MLVNNAGSLGDVTKLCHQWTDPIAMQDYLNLNVISPVALAYVGLGLGQGCISASWVGVRLSAGILALSYQPLSDMPRSLTLARFAATI